ncbi:MAG: hypothetical protein A2428_16750 [Bdellovibrionales bacterium RIFOXYC1_FULL_54_43]|nr:MAG: hypothetical protein A2428_16750 [Bdellovibrionales bacterium RIFOXYC1_FULL_54_43]OFZ84411.1 MAG: hypothetical protein A2603_03160 [Bdellovibrionales bacterium RIFOXYD1_FULL_55_31]
MVRILWLKSQKAGSRPPGQLPFDVIPSNVKVCPESFGRDFYFVDQSFDDFAFGCGWILGEVR